MKKVWKAVGSILLACSLFTMTGCFDFLGAPSGGGFSGGTSPSVPSTPTDPEEGNGSGESATPELPDSPDEGGGESNPDGGTDGEENEGGGDSQLPPLPEVPDAPIEEEVRLPETLDFTPQAVNEQYGYQYFASLEDGEKFCRFYWDMYNACCALSDSADVPATQVDISGTKTDLYIVKKLNYSQYSLTPEEAFSVWKVFRMEYPEFYYLDNGVTYGSTTFNLQMYAEYASGATRTQIQADIEAMANDCFSYLSSDMTATEMALTIYDYVITANEYAYKADGVTPEDASWAHNLVGIAQSGKGVCETYAKAFDYLTSLIGIDAVTVSGNAGKETDENWYGHAWNIVKIDGVWYNVDSTWGDQKDISGNELIYRDWFGVANTEFVKTHVADLPTAGYGIGWQYPLPTLSEKSLAPVTMAEGTNAGKTYGCIDYAFADMTNEGSEYTITLYPDTRVTSAKGTNVHLSEVSFTTGTMPKVQKISFLGKLNGFRKLDLRTDDDVVLWSNVYLKYIAWTYPSITKNGFTVSGDYYTSEVEIRG